MNDAELELKTPHSLGFRMPAEWEQHSATWLAWPHTEEDWPGKFAPIAWVYAEIIKALADREAVNLIVRNEKTAEEVTHCLTQSCVNIANVRLWIQETDRSWLRDSGPIFVVDSE